MWNLVLNFLLSTLLSELLRPKQHFDRPKPAGLDQFNFPTSTEDRACPVLWGTREVKAPNALWYGDKTETELTRKIRTGLFSSERVTEGYRYYLGLQLGLCVDGVDNVLAIKAGDTTIYSGNASANSTVPVSGSWEEGSLQSGVSGDFVFRSGNSSAVAYLDSFVEVNPAYEWMTHAVFLGPSAGAGKGFVGVSERLRDFSFVLRRLPKVERFGVSATDYSDLAAVGAYDANPAFALLELLCDPLWGVGLPAELLDLPSFVAAATKLKAEGNGLSLLWDSPRPCADIGTEILKQANANIYAHLGTGLVTLDLVRPEDAPVLHLDESNVVRLESVTRSAPDETTNEVRCSFEDSTGEFKQRMALAQDLAGIESAGQVIPATVQYPGAANPDLVSALVLRDLRAFSSALVKVSLRVALPPGVYLHPGELVSLTWPLDDIVDMKLRIVRVRYSESGKGEVGLELVQDVFLPGVGTYAASVPTLPPSPPPAGTAPGVVAQLEAWPAPYALTGSSADRFLVMAFAPDAATTGCDIALKTNPSDAPEYLDRKNIGFSVRGYLVSALEADTTVPSLTISITASQRATLQRFGSRKCYLVINTEAMSCTGISINGAGTQATLSGLKRGLWDTVPEYHGANSFVSVLCDYAIDPAPVRTTVRNDASTVVESYDGQDSLYVLAQGRNSVGVASFGPEYQASLGSNNGWNNNGSPPGFVRAPLPVAPGNVRLAGSLGASRTAIAPGVTRSGSTASVTWAPRNRLSMGDAEWLVGGSAAEANTGHMVQVHYSSNGGSSWSSVSSGLVASGTSTLSFSATPIPVGALVRVVVYPAKSAGGGYVYGRSQTWYWVLN